MIKPMLCFLLDVITPRFIEEDVAFMEFDGEIRPLYKVEEVLEGERVDYVGRVRSFNLMGFAIGGRLVGRPMAFDEWKRSREETAA